MARFSGERQRPLASALGHFDDLRKEVAGRCVAVFLDYDGTLTPIVAHPSQALLSDATRDLLRDLARRCTVAIVSGRDLDDLRGHVRLDGIFYAGSHGFQVAGPDGWQSDAEGATELLPQLDGAERDLREAVSAASGAWVERKRFAIAVHYRQVAESDVPALERLVARVAEAYPDLRRTAGKKVFELRPAIDWDKGAVVRSLLARLGLSEGGLPIYIGDDLTDEDGFRGVASTGIGIVVGDAPERTAASYTLADHTEVARFLEALVAEIE